MTKLLEYKRTLEVGLSAYLKLVLLLVRTGE
jgi:hypothetical protein